MKQQNFTLKHFGLTIMMMMGSLLISAQVEICDNRIDDDGDGLIDCLDPDCSYSSDDCWQCATDFYQVHSNTTLVSLDPQIGTYTVMATIDGASAINGAQFNPVDGHVYAPCTIDGEHKLGMLNQSGKVVDTGLTLPGSSIFYVGAIDAEGKMYLSNGAGIHMVDLQKEELEVINLNVSHPGVADFSLDITRGLFYGITSSGQLRVFDPYSLEVKSYDLAGSINTESGAFGAAWSCVDGSFFAYNNNSGKIYSVDVVNLVATEVLNATGNLSINDGFNCVLAPPPFESDCGNGTDDDGDGLEDCEDPDCYNSNVCTVEICDNGIDDDNDGWIDCSDTECFSLEICVEICDNGIDDNGNGLVDGDDPQCGTSGGVSGGLESNRRLSDKISLRNFYAKVKDNKDFINKTEGVIPFESSDVRSLYDIASFIPTDVLDAYVAESSPEDLIGITNATDVSAADYYVNENRVASILAIQSENGVYEHTKYICDRLDGSRLLDISYLYAFGGNFISYELLNKFGQVEYAVSFSGHLEGNEFAIENHWNLHNYTKEKDFYNFQIWAHSYADLIVLLESTLEKMDELANIKSIEHSAIPKVFITNGTYQNGELKLTLRNKINCKNITFKGMLTREEGGELSPLEQEIELTGANQEIIYIQTGFIYDLGAALSSAGSPDDELFVADGAWGIDDQNPGAMVQNFDVYAQEFQQEGDVFQIERSIEAEASVKDYLNIYRSLDAKLNPYNLSTYNTLAFEAAGEGQMEITIVKTSIENWEDQYRLNIALTEDEKRYGLSISNFQSATTDQELDLRDVSMIVFTLLGNNDTFETKALSMSELRFENATISATNEDDIKVEELAYPNPASDHVFIPTSSEDINDLGLTIFDATGKIMTTQRTLSSESLALKVNVIDYPNGIYFYQVENNGEIINSGKFVKLKE